MKVELLSYTPDAMNLLLRTKNTRLKFESDPASWSEEQKCEQLSYMRDTIKSSYEFVDYTFSIEGVSRAFTHELVRTRTGSYAQESQRTIDASGNGYLNPFDTTEPVHHQREADRGHAFDDASALAFATYRALLADGAAAQDARGILPTATLTNIIAKFNLRTLHETAKVRLCTRTAGEYQRVFREMRARVIEVHPWVEEHAFIEVHCASEGTCAFPRYGRKECKFYDPRMDLDALKLETRAKFWSAKELQVAVPIAINGKTM